MRRPRKIIVFIATSVDGYIARPDGDVRWLDRPRPKGNYGYSRFFKCIDTILWGRKTYSKSIEMGMKPRWQGDWFVDSGYGWIKNYVFSRQTKTTSEPGAKFVNEPVKAFAQRLRAQPGKNIMMMGGGGLIASFLDEGEIDEFSIHVIPHPDWRRDSRG